LALPLAVGEWRLVEVLAEAPSDTDDLFGLRRELRGVWELVATVLRETVSSVFSLGLPSSADGWEEDGGVGMSGWALLLPTEGFSGWRAGPTLSVWSVGIAGFWFWIEDWIVSLGSFWGFVVSEGWT
jgi:hypothetical protein